MRTSTVLAVAALVATPALSAPLRGHRAGPAVARPHIEITREDASDESGAIDFKKVATHIGAPIRGHGNHVILNREEDSDDSGALHLLHHGGSADNVAWPVRREEASDDSEALKFGKILKTAAGIASNFIKRDEADDSEALKFGKILKTAAGVASNFLKREELEELMAREPEPFHPNLGKFHAPTVFPVREDADDSEALKFGKILKTAAGVASQFLKRDELEELMAREPEPFHPIGKFHAVSTLPVREDADDSEALKFGKILKTAAGVASQFLKREDELEMRSIDELD